MISSLSNVQTILANLFLIIAWNMIIFWGSIKLDKNNWNPKKNMFREKKWEKNGEFYVKVLKIKKWKDLLPQHVGKNGFSKKHLVKLKELSTEYIQEFIFETCRAEWNHTMCCLYPVISFLINEVNYALLFSFVSIITNIPFIFIQRYNRIRLKKLLHRRMRLCNNTV